MDTAAAAAAASSSMASAHPMALRLRPRKNPHPKRLTRSVRVERSVPDGTRLCDVVVDLVPDMSVDELRMRLFPDVDIVVEHIHMAWNRTALYTHDDNTTPVLTAFPGIRNGDTIYAHWCPCPHAER